MRLPVAPAVSMGADKENRRLAHVIQSERPLSIGAIRLAWKNDEKSLCGEIKSSQSEKAELSKRTETASEKKK
jgi:hypothetical protein